MAPAAPAATAEADFVARLLPSYRAALRGRRTPPSSAVQEVFQALGAGDLGLARVLAQAEVGAHPDDPEAALAGGAVLFLSGAYESARPLLEQALAGGAGRGGAERAFFFYGACLQRLGVGAGARAALLAHLELAPGDPDSLLALGQLALEDGQAAEAIGRFEQARTAFADVERAGGGAMAAGRARALAGLGNAYLQQDRLEDAHTALQESVRLDPSQPQPFYALSRVCLRRGDREGARQAIDHFGRLSAGG